MFKKHQIILFLLIAFCCSLPANEIIIANTSELEMTKSNLKKVYLGKKKSWADGTKYIVTIQKEGKVHDSFMKNIIRRKPRSFIRYWLNKVFSGKGIMPHTFENENKLIEFIETTKGAIGYISKNNLKGLPKNIVVLKIN